MQRLNDRAPKKLTSPISRARNLVWALLIQGLLNDQKLAEYLEEFGNSLAKEVSFREVLKTLASGKILPVLRDILEDKLYQDKIDKEKYNFMRTKEIFKKCMDSAYDKFGWTKKSL
jgi:hypothetical protein